MDSRDVTRSESRGDEARADSFADSFADLDDSVVALLGRLGHASAVPIGGVDGALAPLPPGAMVGENFKVVGRVGVGGMAVVYLAHDLRLGRAVAIKLYRWPPEPGRLSRTMREAMAMARLTDSHVLTLYEVGEFAGRVYIAMEFVDGWNARDWQHSERPGRRELLRMYLRAGEGLAAAHAVGVVHCDFKPDNVLIGRDGRVRVADFGLARVAPGAANVTVTAHDQGDAGALERLRAGAQESTVAGTPAYMAPEQRERRSVDPRTDQYAFCVALHEALRGRRPGPLDEQPTKGADEGPPLPTWIERVLRRGRDPEPDRRFSSMAALLAALRDDPAARRRRWLVRGGLATGLGLALAGAAEVFARPPLCVDTRAPLADVWGAGRRSQVAAAFARACADGASCPPKSHARTQALLDDYADAWAAMRTNACEATHVHGVQSAALLDRRMGCLDERLRSLDALVDVLVATDAVVARRAPVAAAALPSLASCADVAHLTSALALPDDPGLVPRVEAARARVVQAEAHKGAGRTAEALTTLRGVEGEAGRLGYAPLRAEVDLALGKMLAETDPGAGEAHLRAAYYVATAHGHPEVSALAATHLVWTIGYVQSRLAEADAWSLQALAETERRGTEVHVRARALSHVASLRTEQGRYEAALTLQDQALAHLGDEHAPSLALALRANRATTLDALGRYGEARVEYEAVLAAEQRLYGPRHPWLATSYSNLGLLRVRDAPAEAVALHRQALATLAPADGGRWESLLNLSIALVASGVPEEGIVAADEALAITRRMFGPDHPHVGMCLGARASAHRFAGRLEAAVDDARGALGMVERAYPAEHDEVSAAQNMLAETLVAAGRPAEALPWFARSLAAWERRADPSHPRVVEVLVEQGEALEQLGRAAEALAPFTRALEIAGRAEVRPEMVMRARAGRARVTR